MFFFLKTFINFIKKASLVFAVFFIVISLFLYFLNKDKVSLSSPKSSITSIEKNRIEIYRIINDKELSKTKNGKLSIALYREALCKTIGEACTDNPSDADKNYSKSTLGFITNLFLFPLANPPASGVYWAYSGLQSTGFIPQTYAAEGIGFAGLKPIMNLWKIFRDLAYMFLVIVLIAIGFMVMFRAKINPQTVISVENALPKIVIALILITFSFAIAGFLIDLMYVIIAISISAISGNNAYYDAGKFTNQFMSANVGQIYTSLMPNVGLTKIGNSLMLLLGLPLTITVRSLSGILGAWLIPKTAELILQGIWALTHIADAAVVGNTAQNFVTSILTGPINIAAIILGVGIGIFFLPQWIIGGLIWFTIVFLFFRIFFQLFNTYIRIFLLIIFSPLILLFEAVPGKPAFSFWLKSLFADILSFPIVVILVVVGYVMQNTIAAGINLWTPPFLMGIDPNLLSILLGMSIMLMIPELMKLTRDLLGVKDLPVGFGIGTFFGGAGSAVGGGMGMLGQFGSVSLGLQGIGNLKGMLGRIGTVKSGEQDITKVLTPPNVQASAGAQGPAAIKTD